ncbi:MAG TPA: hypothetical protein DCP07_04025 [Lachnospiraceae bacterium]|nr:hypothetical protein [Lachnospiraceae bacterium]
MNEFKERLEAKKRELRDERIAQAGTTAKSFVSKHRYTIMAVAGVLTGVVIGYKIRKDSFIEERDDYDDLASIFRASNEKNTPCIAVQSGHGGAWYGSYNTDEFQARMFLYPIADNLKARDIEPEQVVKACNSLVSDYKHDINNTITNFC